MKKFKKILAITGVFVLLAMYLLTFISAIFATPDAHALFLGSLAATIIIPVFLYAYSLVYKVFYKNSGQGTQETKSKNAFNELKKL